MTEKTAPKCPFCGKALSVVMQIWDAIKLQEHAFNAEQGKYRLNGFQMTDEHTPSRYECGECGHIITAADEVWNALQDLGAH